MMMHMMDAMGLMMLLAVLVFALIIGLAVYAGVRTGLAGGRPDRDAPDARELLQRRLAAGEISAEEYYEREAVLRESQPERRRR